MKRWLRLAARLYPASWRRRYLDEFDALIDDSAPSWHDLFDITTGAIRMHLTSWKTYTAAAALTGAAGVALALWAWSQEPKQYTSTVVFRVIPEKSRATHPSSDKTPVPIDSYSTRARPVLQSLLDDPALNLYPGDRERLPMPDVLEGLNKDLQTEVIDEGGSLRYAVSLPYSDPHKSQQALQRHCRPHPKHRFPLDRSAEPPKPRIPRVFGHPAQTTRWFQMDHVCRARSCRRTRSCPSRDIRPPLHAIHSEACRMWSDRRLARHWLLVPHTGAVHLFRIGVGSPTRSRVRP